ncbi:hypothetical protein HPP92_028355 [Vanilla planifolia]|uniref:Uncharacterized protein n=1 Tax=Vanilla planifolia TaxID=51239 RepID=A0A835PBC8_VANPL|nr:hypothetical protein HPP92_028355 [Vanilla planifolia]
MGDGTTNIEETTKPIEKANNLETMEEKESIKENGEGEEKDATKEDGVNEEEIIVQLLDLWEALCNN